MIFVRTLPVIDGTKKLYWELLLSVSGFFLVGDMSRGIAVPSMACLSGVLEVVAQCNPKGQWCAHIQQGIALVVGDITGIEQVANIPINDEWIEQGDFSIEIDQGGIVATAFAYDLATGVG